MTMATPAYSANTRTAGMSVMAPKMVEMNLDKFDHITDGRKQELTATFTCSSMRKLTLDVLGKGVQPISGPSLPKSNKLRNYSNQSWS